MKRVDLIRTLEQTGCVLVRHGSNHDIYRNVNTGAMQPVPRHREIDEQLARRSSRLLSDNPRGSGS